MNMLMKQEWISCNSTNWDSQKHEKSEILLMGVFLHPWNSGMDDPAISRGYIPSDAKFCPKTVLSTNC